VTGKFLFAASSGASDDRTLALIVLAAFAVGGYRISARHQVVRGRTPWGFPSIVWALICFLIGPFGLLVELIAGRMTPPASDRAALRRPGYGGNRFAGSPGETATFASTARASGQPPEIPNITVHLPLFGWYHDVTGRHELRYWDGKHWSDLVADHGVRASDPLDTPHPPPAGLPPAAGTANP